jgi:parallel beta helix pectate lyase-like protein/K319-like protein
VRFKLSIPNTAALLLAMTHAEPLSATTIDVPADYPMVRDAVHAAASGDTILVAPGVHVGGAWINGKSVTVASWYVVTGDTGLVAQTVLDGVVAGACGGAAGCGGNAVLEFGDNANGSAVVGLTVTNGENGIASGSTVDITRCRIVANGDGVDYVAGSGGTFRNSLFAHNGDDGIDLNGRMDVAILDNDIRDNLDDGIEYRLHSHTGVMKHIDIIGNRITGNGEDGVQIIDYPTVANYVIRIERNLFRANFDGSGLSAAIGCMSEGETIETLEGAAVAERIHVTHNTFIGEKNGVVGGANLIALNNIFASTQGAALRRVRGGSIASYNLFWANGANHAESNIDGSHQLLVSPQMDGAGRLTPPSRAIDAGTAFFQWQGQTVLNLPSSAYNGPAPDLGAFESPANTPPLVNAGPDRRVTLGLDALEMERGGVLSQEQGTRLRADTRLDGTISDDGLPYPPSPHPMWSVVSGPGPVAFANPTLVDAQATFATPGTYLLRLAVSDGLLSTSDLVEVTVDPLVNLPPRVDAGPHQTITLPASATLEGTLMDDGLPLSPGAVMAGWAMVSGPGPVTLDDPALEDARATFTTVGTHVLRLTASDGDLTASDSVVIEVLPIPNAAPVVQAGPDRIIMIPSDAFLDGTVADDGLPTPPGAVTVTWTIENGPGPVTFQDPSLADTRAGFTTAGTYVLRLTANDGALSAHDLVQVTVLPPPPAVERRVSAGSDDAEESDSGRFVRNASDLDLVYDSGNQTVGLRFTGVTVPAGATIIRAYIQFEAEATQSEATSLILRGEAADDPATFASTDGGISSRPRTAASAIWSPPAWTVMGEAGLGQRTPDLEHVIQEIVDRPGWASGNAIAILITGTGKRTARTQEIDPTGAALLHVEYGGLAQPLSAGPAEEAAALPPNVAEVEGSSDAGEPQASGTGPASGAATGRPEFALHGISPQPTRGDLRVEFTLADDGPAALELVDVGGRLVITRNLGALGPGRHTAELRERLPAGVYLVRLTQGLRAVMKKAVVLQ